jgi:uncharacterized Zn finger protein
MSKQELAQKLFSQGLVTRVDKENFTVTGSREYEIQRTPDKNYEFYCKCPAWKFDSEHDCKHCIAVRLFEEDGN